MNWDRLTKKIPYLYNLWGLALLFSLLAIIASIQKYLLPDPNINDVLFTNYNNFLIFSHSFSNLLHNVDLYLPSDHYFDLYKYSPSFALFMGAFYYLPTWLGLLIWNLLNTLLPFWAVTRLKLAHSAKVFILLFIILELLGCVQNAESNGIVLALILLTFSSLERGESILAALWVCIGFYIKIFGGIAGLLFILYPNKRRFILAFIAWGILLAVLPAGLVGFPELITQYKSWFNLLLSDSVIPITDNWLHSLPTLLQNWFKVHIPVAWCWFFGLPLLIAPLSRWQHWKNPAFRLLYLAGLLIWLVIFNHQAESPTYLIAVCGVALWALIEPSSKLRWFGIIFVLILTTLAASDLSPHFFKEEYWRPLHLKALPCIFIWSIITARLLFAKNFAIQFPLKTPVLKNVS